MNLRAELDTKKNGSTRFRADMTRVKRELADLRKVSDDAIRQRSLSDTERERLTNELEEARKRYLQSLNLYCCENITDASLLEVARRCSNLQSLDLTWCSNITDAGVLAVTRGCSNLQSLGLYGSTRITYSLPNILRQSYPQLELRD